MRVKCGNELNEGLCKNDLFFLHVPPKSLEKKAKIVYLICNKCRHSWSVHLGSLPNVDSEGYIGRKQSHREYEKKEVID